MKAYVYAIIVDDVVRYIGKGTGNRADKHLRIMHSILRRRAAGELVRATHLHNRMAKAWRNGSSIEIEILIDGLTDDAAFAKEIELIASIRVGQLWNQTIGGENPPKAISRSAEFITKVTASNIKTWSDPELRARQSAEKKVHWLRPEYRAKLEPVNRRPKPSVSEKAKARWADPEFRAKMDRIFNDSSKKQQRSETLKRAWETRRAKAK